MHCTICNLPTGNIVGSTLPQCKCGWQKPNPSVTQRTWVGLTRDEIQDLLDIVDHYNYPQDLIVYTQAKLKEKNNG